MRSMKTSLRFLGGRIFLRRTGIHFAGKCLVGFGHRQGPGRKPVKHFAAHVGVLAPRCSRRTGRSGRRPRRCRVARAPSGARSGRSRRGGRAGRACPAGRASAPHGARCSPRSSGTPGRMQREADEHEAATPGIGPSACAREVMRPPNDLPPASSGSAGHEPRASADRRPHGGLGERRRIRRPGAALHVGELVAERGDASPRERRREAARGRDAASPLPRRARG